MTKTNLDDLFKGEMDPDDSFYLAISVRDKDGKFKKPIQLYKISYSRARFLSSDY